MSERTGETKQRWSSRKFWAVMSWGMIATALLWFDKIDMGTWETIIMFLIPAYVAGNVAQRVMGKGGSDALKD